MPCFVRAPAQTPTQSGGSLWHPIPDASPDRQSCIKRKQTLTNRKSSCIIRKVTDVYRNLAEASPQQAPSLAHPLNRLPREDLDLIMELVLLSGSLKDLAAAYGVSYPTIRGRVDKVIERLRLAREGRKPDPLNEMLAAMVERGELSITNARALQELARRQQAAAAGRAVTDPNALSSHPPV